MKNSYGLSEERLKEIKKRDIVCVYCHKNMLDHNINNQRGDWYSIEHLNYLPPWNNPETVVICCWSCNSSRGNKKIVDWFKTEYCITWNININTVSKEVRKYVQNIESKE